MRHLMSPLDFSVEEVEKVFGEGVRVSMEL